MLKNWMLNIGLGILALALLIWLTFMWMGWYTHHNESLEVPNLTGVIFNDAVEKLDDAGLRYEVIDSIYTPELRKDAVTEQDPLPGSKVKPNRIIYLVVNSLGKPKVKVPRLVDQSFTLAKALIKSNGLVLGNVEYKYDEIGHNLVISQTINGREVPAGKLVEKGTRIDLVVATNEDRSAPEDSTLKTDPMKLSNESSDPAPAPKKSKKKKARAQ